MHSSPRFNTSDLVQQTVSAVCTRRAAELAFNVKSTMSLQLFLNDASGCWWELAAAPMRLRAQTVTQTVTQTVAQPVCNLLHNLLHNLLRKLLHKLLRKLCRAPDAELKCSAVATNATNATHAMRHVLMQLYLQMRCNPATTATTTFAMQNQPI